MNLKEKINILKFEYGVKNSAIYEQMQITANTFKVRMKNENWKTGEVLLFDMKYGILFSKGGVN